MNQRIVGVCSAVLLLALSGCAEQPGDGVDPRVSLRSALQTLSDGAVDPLLRHHFRSMIDVIETADYGSASDTGNIERLWGLFEDPAAAGSPRQPEAYLDRSRQLIVSWVSPTDGEVSFTWLRLPANWDPQRTYPLYVQLHGLWEVAGDPLAYMTYPFVNPGTSSAFEDGYHISPWGRGNLWYRGIAETDIWECIATIRSLVRVDRSRTYLCGHSMGGYGAWHIALGSVDTWAALGIHAGALWYDQSEVSVAAATTLRDMPTYFVVGDADGLFAANQIAHQLLREAGNPNLAFVVFGGGHDYRQEDVERMYAWLRQFDRDERLGSRGD